MTLAIVIPVHNDQDNLDRLLGQVAAMGIFDQVIVADDASDPPMRLPSAAPAGTVLLRRETNGGAGAARNLALPHIATDHVIFFDSDDSLTQEFTWLWDDLCESEQAFDFCLFRHHDTRMSREVNWGQLYDDNVKWNAANAGHGTLFAVNDDARIWLAQTINYPWNKIYSHAFIQRAALRFSETIVHNDIFFHWHSFHAADTILASDRVAAVHRFSITGTRLSNAAGSARLCLPAELDKVGQLLAGAARGRPDLRPAFLAFSSLVLDWAVHHVAPDLQERFRQEAAAMLRRHLTPEVQATVRQRIPTAVARLEAQMQARE